MLEVVLHHTNEILILTRSVVSSDSAGVSLSCSWSENEAPRSDNGGHKLNRVSPQQEQNVQVWRFSRAIRTLHVRRYHLDPGNVLFVCFLTNLKWFLAFLPYELKLTFNLYTFVEQFHSVITHKQLNTPDVSIKIHQDKNAFISRCLRTWEKVSGSVPWWDNPVVGRDSSSIHNLRKSVQ